MKVLSPRAMISALTVTGMLAVSAVAFLAQPEPAAAFPKFANQEGVKCAYCHVRATGGGKRNYRGSFYDKNNNSFAGFDDKAEAEKAGEPIAPDADSVPKSLKEAMGEPVTPPVATATKDPTVASYRAKANATALALKQSPTAANKKAHAASLTALAYAILHDKDIAPEKQYPEALKISRQALAMDKTNKDAAANIKQIVAAYKKMGKPVPK